ncbi:MAG: c-type cytochrome [Gammaproteobacteria bacterium]
MSNAQDDAIFVRNFSLVLAGLTMVGILCFVLAKIVYGNFAETQGGDQSASKRIAPVGSVNVGEPMVVANVGAESSQTMASAEPAAAPSDPGEATYGKICFSCHEAGIAGAPKTGDQEAWASRLEKGTEMLVSNAINGIQGDAGIMPARGGLSNLTDDEVRAAVMYMLSKLEPGDAAAQAPAEAMPVTAVPAATTEPAPTPAAEPQPAAVAVAAGRGKEVYDAACFICHASGVAGAPKFGDAASWAARAEKGMETLYEHSIKGFMGENGLMPPKGGRPDFSDDDVKAAVDYMVNSSK